MPHFTPVQNINLVTPLPEWKNAEKFRSEFRIEDEKGNLPTPNGQGPYFLLKKKFLRPLTAWEAFGSRLMQLASFPIQYLSNENQRTSNAKSTKTIRYGVPIPNKPQEECLNLSWREEIDPDALSVYELGREIQIPENAIAKIQKCIASDFSLDESGSVTFYSSQTSHKVFSLPEAPEYIFKMLDPKISPYLGDSFSMKERYRKMIYAQTVCRTHQFSLLKIPSAKLFHVVVGNSIHQVIVEKKLRFDCKDGAQEELWSKEDPNLNAEIPADNELNVLPYSNIDTLSLRNEVLQNPKDQKDINSGGAADLNETISQLAKFICITGYSDVKPENNPILEKTNKLGQKKIGLIDLEFMEGPSVGLFSDTPTRRGLIHYVNAEQKERIREISKEHGVEF